MPYEDPGYDYAAKGDRKVNLRFTQVYGHDYTLQFSTADPDDADPILRPAWFTVRQYVPTASPTEKPGDGCPDRVYGNWMPRTFYVESGEAEKQMLQALREHVRTVHDLYRAFIEDGTRQMEQDMDKHRAYREALDRLPESIV